MHRALKTRWTRQDLNLLLHVTYAHVSLKRHLIHITYDPNTPGRSNRGTLYWRLERLVQTGLITKTPYDRHDFSYTISKEGLAILKARHPEFGAITHGIPVYHYRPDSKDRFHELALNDIWVAFKKTGRLSRWISSFELKLDVQKNVPATYKVYDALVRLHMGDHTSQIAIEYERTLKSKRRYVPVADAIQNDEHITLILYVCPNDAYKSQLKSLLSGIPKVYFTVEDRLLANPLGCLIEQFGPAGNTIYASLEQLLTPSARRLA